MKTEHSVMAGMLIGALAATTLGASPLQASAGPADRPAGRKLTLAAARAEAEANSPVLRAAAADVDEARGRLIAARTYPHNPRIEIEGADRSGPGGSSTDRGLGISQRIELAGQRGERTAVAGADLAAAESAYARRRREVRATVERAFADSVRAGEMLEIARVDLDLTQNLLDFEERRLEAGAGTAIDVNLARAAAGRALRHLQKATAAWREARARLAEAAGLDPASPPRPAGSLPDGAQPLPPLEELTRRAFDERRDLDALREAGELAEHRVELERSLALPDLELGAFAAREEGDDIVGLRAGIALPLFDRNQGGIAEARATVDRSAAELHTVELRVRREVAAAYAHHQAAAEALEALRGLVVDTLDENLELLRRAADAGELSTTDVLLLRRELVEARREHVEAAGELWLSRIELELAVGSDLAPATSARSEGDGR